MPAYHFLTISDPNKRPANEKGCHQLPLLPRLPDASQHQSPVVTACLPANPVRQTLFIPGLVRSLDICQVLLIPVTPDHTVDQLVILGAQASHGILKKSGLKHVPIRTVLQLVNECVLHVSLKLLADDILELGGIFPLILVRDGADLVVVAQAEDAAHGHRVVADLALGGSIDGVDVPVNVGLDHRSRVFGACSRKDNLEVAFRLERELVFNSGGQVTVEGVLVLGLDSVDVGVAPAEEDIIEDGFPGTWATHGIVKSVDVLSQRTASDGCEALAEPAAVLVGQMLRQVGVEGALVSEVEDLDL